jgi:HD-GYP domain-containing protein (c-di-GMP phosphodiesterase class II)
MEDVDVADVRIHPQKGAAIVASLPGFIPIAKIILDHHEWISGEGYPRGLRGEEISLESQIIKTADKLPF